MKVLLLFKGSETNQVFKCDEFHASRGNNVWVSKEHWDIIKGEEVSGEKVIDLFEVIETKKGKLPEVQTVAPARPFKKK